MNDDNKKIIRIAIIVILAILILVYHSIQANKIEKTAQNRLNDNSTTTTTTTKNNNRRVGK